MNEENKKQNQPPQLFKRKAEDIDLKSKLLSSPELFLPEKASDEYLDKLLLKAKLFKPDEFLLDDFVAEIMTKYESKFHKGWFYALADMYSVSRSVMDVWVKPDFVRQFIVQAVYGRFPYLMLRELRKRKLKLGDSNNKLYHCLTKNASEQLDTVIEQVYRIVVKSNTPLDFWMAYSNEYKIYFQTKLF